MKFFIIFLEHEVFRCDFIEMDIGGDRESGQLLKNFRVFAGWVGQHVRASLINGIEELLLRFGDDLLSIQVNDVQILLRVLLDLVLVCLFFNHDFVSFAVQLFG